MCSPESGEERFLVYRDGHGSEIPFYFIKPLFKRFAMAVEQDYEILLDANNNPKCLPSLFFIGGGAERCWIWRAADTDRSLSL